MLRHTTTEALPTRRTANYDKAIADLHQGYSAQSARRQRIFQPRRRPQDEGRLRQGRRRLHQGHPTRSEQGGCVQQPRRCPQEKRDCDKALPITRGPSVFNPNIGGFLSQRALAYNMKVTVAKPSPTIPRPSDWTRCQPNPIVAGVRLLWDRRLRQGRG